MPVAVKEQSASCENTEYAQNGAEATQAVVVWLS